MIKNNKYYITVFILLQPRSGIEEVRMCWYNEIVWGMYEFFI